MDGSVQIYQKEFLLRRVFTGEKEGLYNVLDWITFFLKA
jgi:hypothetical protein